MQRTLLALLCASFAAPATASTRDLDSHEHGASTLDIVIDGDVIEASFLSPWMNLVGFEHEPSTHEQEHAVEEALESLGDAVAMLGIPSGAECSPQSVDVDSSMSMAEHDDEHHDEHDEEHHDEHDEEHHDEHDEEHHDEHDHEGDESTHSEVSVVWTLSCANVDELATIQPGVIERFPGIEVISVQLAGPGGQSAAQVDKDASALSLAEIL